MCTQPAAPPPIHSWPYLHTGVHPPLPPHRCAPSLLPPLPIPSWPYLHTGVHPSCRPPLPLLALPPHRCAPSLQTPPPSPTSTQMCTQPADPSPFPYLHTDVHPACRPLPLPLPPHRCAPSLQTPPPPLCLTFTTLHRCAPSLQTPPPFPSWPYLHTDVHPACRHPPPPPPPFISALPPQRCAPTAEG